MPLEIIPMKIGVQKWDYTLLSFDSKIAHRFHRGFQKIG